MEVVGQINIDFYILETGSPKKLSVFDDSEWLYSETLPSYLVIKLPGSKKEKAYSFKKNAINTLNSHNLGISCLKGDCTEEQYVSLPDGVYTITLKSGYEGIEETKYYLKTDTFDIDFAKVMAKYDSNSLDEGFIDYMTRIRFLKGVAESHTKLGDFVKANRFFTEIRDMLDKYSDCKNC